MNFLQSNRGFLYGDGFFETFLAHKDTIPLFAWHQKRFEKSLSKLKLKHPENLKNWLENIPFSDEQPTWRCRLTVFRTGGGLYTPETETTDYCIDFKPFVKNNTDLEKVEICPSVRLACDEYSAIKSISAMRYTVTGLFKKENDLDECFLLNAHNRISEASSSNMFVRIGSEIITPPLSEGCIDGVMRRFLLEQSNVSDFKIIEDFIEISTLDKAEEIFITNAIQGVRSISRWKNIFLKTTAADYLKTFLPTAFNT